MPSHSTFTPLIESSDFHYSALPMTDQTGKINQTVIGETESTTSTIRHKESWIKRLFLPATNDLSVTTTEERRFVKRLDLILMTYGCISYCIKQIDQSNYASAYVSGMREDVSV